jgi:hypothetical protein
MKDVIVIGVAKIEHDRGAFLTATDDYDEHLAYPTCRNPR